MEAEEIAVGMAVRYPRTGTAGTVDRIEEIAGETYAEIDSTGLLYRADTLEPAALPDRRRTHKKEDITSYAERQSGFDRDIENAWINTDQSCEGGG
ncbi:DUF2098 domain-containing protein [Methanofollis fontis]|uniref:DUF2098 domain-containing protein n=1 Tax=Methanofollis fontis TaxID=2052832 RepID=A0A483CX37_9EURY|nr:DUF2098 domain-containing protein [Methanofollis fontis]TAJ45880.1 DUF2098 domain-containing protein [Methanofollis fontis]